MKAASKGLAVILSGTAGGQLVLVAITPVLSRLYSPQEFGQYSITFALAMILAGVAGLRFEWALPLPQDDWLACALFRMYCLSLLVVTGLTFVAVSIISTAEIKVRLAPLPVVWSLPLLVALIGVFNVLSQAALREKRYNAVGYRAILQGAGTAVGQTLFGIGNAGAPGLAAGQVLGRAISCLGLLSQSSQILARPPKESYAKAWASYRKFPLLFAPSSLLNLLGTYLPVLLVSHIYGGQVTGNLSMALQVLLAPASLLAAAVGQVYIGELASRLRAGVRDNRGPYLRASRALTVPAGALLVAALVFAPVGFRLVLGDEWEAAGRIAQALAVSVSLGLVVSPLSYVFVAYERGRTSLVVDISRIGLVLSGAYVGTRFGDGELAVCWGMFLGQSLNYVATWFIALRIVTDRSTHN